MEEYLDNDNVDEKKVIKRMKIELQHARDSSTLLPKNDLLFRVQITVPETGKRRQKSLKEFCEALRTLLGRRSNRSSIEYSSFKTNLQHMTLGSRRNVGH